MQDDRSSETSPLRLVIDQILVTCWEIASFFRSLLIQIVDRCVTSGRQMNLNNKLRHIRLGGHWGKWACQIELYHERHASKLTSPRGSRNEKALTTNCELWNTRKK